MINRMKFFAPVLLKPVLQVPVRVHSASFDSIDLRLKSSETSVDGDETDGSKKKKKKKLFFFKKSKSKASSHSLCNILSYFCCMYLCCNI
jgi:hypothetical protein